MLLRQLMIDKSVFKLAFVTRIYEYIVIDT